MVNERIIANEAVTTIETSKTDAEKMGAIAFFGDKYGERVRVVRTGGFSTELCGGTHVPSTGQVGPLILVSEGSVGSNIRRVEALTGAAAYDHLSDLRKTLMDVSSVLKAQPDRVLTAAHSLAKRLKDTEARIDEFEARERSDVAKRLIGDAEEFAASKLVVDRVDGLGGDGLRSLAFQVRDRIGSGIGVLCSVTDGKAALVTFVTADLVAGGASAADIAAAGATVLGGGASRDVELAQAGGPHVEAIDEALAAARQAGVETLTRP
jgi:alanyl-tRNA synthetase